MNRGSQTYSTAPAVTPGRSDLIGRTGIDLAPESWPSVAELKSIEAAGFRWLQVYSPPLEMLADPRYAVRHAKALASALGCLPLELVLHAPSNLQLGQSLHDRAFEGLLEYAHQVGAGRIVYHALDFPRRGRQSAAEELSLRRVLDWAEVLDVRIHVENLCPTYPGPGSVCHDPLAVRSLVERLDSPMLSMAFDLGHAHVVAQTMGVELAALLEPVVDAVGMFHVHDNFGLRTDDGVDGVVDPLKQDLHLRPGQGDLPWERVSKFVVESDAPIVLEVNPQYRAPANEMRDDLVGALARRIGLVRTLQAA